MRSATLSALLLMAATSFLMACSRRDPPASPPPAASPGSAATQGATIDLWLGRWNGPEGTSLELSAEQGRYQVRIRNLDGPRTFEGHATDTGIAFERDGTRELIRATRGAETGMKWLADKSDCLTVKAGEGYCRD